MASDNKTQFTESFKREIVREYRKGGITLKALADKHEGLTTGMIVRWKAKKKRKSRAGAMITGPAVQAPKPAPKKPDKPLFVLTGRTLAELRTQLENLESLQG